MTKYLYLLAVSYPNRPIRALTHTNRKEAIRLAKEAAVGARYGEPTNGEWAVYRKPWSPGDSTNTYDYPTLRLLSECDSDGTPKPIASGTGSL